MNTPSPKSSKRKSTNPEDGTSDTSDSKKIKREPESENENKNVDIGSSVKVDEQLTVKFEDGLKEEPKVEFDHSGDFIKISNLTSKLTVELRNQVDLTSEYAVIAANFGRLLGTFEELGQIICSQNRSVRPKFGIAEVFGRRWAAELRPNRSSAALKTSAEGISKIKEFSQLFSKKNCPK